MLPAPLLQDRLAESSSSSVAAAGPHFYQPDTSPDHQHYSLPPTACRRMFAQAIMVGYMSKEGKVLRINPREDSMLEEGDSVIVLSQSRESSCCPLLWCMTGIYAVGSWTWAAAAPAM